MLRIGSISPHWITLFPQHGPGAKHHRDVALVRWQRDISARHPESLVRGLIESDGCRFIARQVRDGRMYCYPRYCFSNLSRHILEIFAEHLELIRVRFTYSSPFEIQIARKASVARLDRFVGPKIWDPAQVVGTSHA